MTLVRVLLVRLITGVLGLLVFASAIWLLSIWLIPGDFSSNFFGEHEQRSKRPCVWIARSSNATSSS